MPATADGEEILRDTTFEVWDPVLRKTSRMREIAQRPPGEGAPVRPNVKRLSAGAVAGATGLLAMDVVWFRRYRRGGGQRGFRDWEFVTGLSGFDDAPAPGRVAQRLARAVGIDLPDQAAVPATAVVHWATGVAYGIGHAALPGPSGVMSGGVVTGAAAFVNGYVALGALGVYRPAWEYDVHVLVPDLTAHLVFGVVTAAVYRLLAGSVRGAGRG